MTNNELFRAMSKRQDKKNKAARAAVMAVAPDAYYQGGMGWCGPNWEVAEAADRAAREAFDAANPRLA